MATLYVELFTFIILSRSFLLRMRNNSNNICRENKKNIFSNFLSENRALYEIMWKNIVEPDSPQMVILRMRIACLILKATNTQSENTILITIPRQQ